MENNRIELIFDKSLTSLAGYDFGVETYTNQVKNKLTIMKPFEIVFPSQIKSVASSFVQGFFEEIVETIGLLQTEKNCHVISDRDGFTQMIMTKLN